MAVTPTIYTEHPLSRDLIDPDAVKIVGRLRRLGYEAYLVGGCVRDLILGIKPKDFDIATSATPREIRSSFRNCRVIGRRFRLCHIFFGDKIIEVATFRAEPLAKLEEDEPGTPEGSATLAHARATEETTGDAEAEGVAEAETGGSAGRFVVRTETRETREGREGREGRDDGPREGEARIRVVEPVRPEELAEFAAGIFDVPLPGETEPPARPPAPERVEAPLAGAAEPWNGDRSEGAIATARGLDERERRLRLQAIAEEKAARARERGGAGREAERGREPERGREREAITPTLAPRERSPDGRERDLEGRELHPGDRRSRRRPRWMRLLEEDPPQGFGTAEEDALLRDFTINALFYDPLDETVIDYVGGMNDLKARLLRTIGDPDRRIVEDPVRILRAVKAAARLGLSIDPPTYEAMARHRALLAEGSPRRLLEEIVKLLASGAAAPAFRLMARLGVVAHVLPELAPYFQGDGSVAADSKIFRYLEALDRFPRERLDASLEVGALFYLPACDALAREAVARPGEEPRGRDGGGRGRGRERGDREADAIVDDLLREFAQRHSLAKKVRFEATHAILLQRPLRRPRLADRQAQRGLVRRVAFREDFGLAIRLLEVVSDAEGLDPEILDFWQGVADEAFSERRPRRREEQEAEEGEEEDEAGDDGRPAPERDADDDDEDGREEDREDEGEGDGDEDEDEDEDEGEGEGEGTAAGAGAGAREGEGGPRRRRRRRRRGGRGRGRGIDRADRDRESVSPE